MVSGLCGSQPYIAPEAYVQDEFDGRALDIWACGIIYVAMRTGSFLWNIAKKDEDDLYAQYLEDRRQEAGFVPLETLRRVSCTCFHPFLMPGKLTAHASLRHAAATSSTACWTRTHHVGSRLHMS